MKRGMVAYAGMALALATLAMPLAAKPIDRTRLNGLIAKADATDVDADPKAYMANFEAALAEARRIYPETHPEIAARRQGIATALASQGKMDEASAIIEAILPILEKAGPAFLRPLADTYNVRGFIANLRGDHAGAIAAAQRSLDMNRAMAAGKPNKEVAIQMANLAAINWEAGRSENTLAMNAEAIAMARALSPVPADVAVWYSNRVAYLHTMGRSSEAVATAREGLAVSEAILPEGHPALASLYANLGAILVRQGRPKAAAPFLRHGFELIEKAAGGPNQNSASMRMMFATAIAANEPHVAIDFLDSAIPIIEGQLGAESTRAIQSHEVRAAALLGSGRFAEALVEQRRVVEVRDRKLLPQHRDRMSGRAILAKIALAKGDLVLAEKSAAEGIALRSAVVPASHPDLLAERSLLVLIRARAKTVAPIKSLSEAHNIYDLLIANAALNSAAPMLDNARFAFRNIAEVMFRAGDQDGAFKAQQWSARTTVDEAAASAAATRAEAGRPAIKQAMDARRKLVAERAASMASIEAQITAPKAEFDLAAANARIAGIETKIAEASRQLSADGALPGQFSATSLTAAQARIGKKQLFLQITSGQDHYLITALGRSTVLQYMTSETARQVADRVIAIRATLDQDGEDRAFDRANALGLYQTLISTQLDQQLRRADHLLVAANDALGAMPFAVLVPDAKATGYLIDRVAISRLPGAPQEEHTAALPSSQFFAMGDALQAARGTSDTALRGGRAEALAKLPALPQAAAELNDLALAVGARAPQILTGVRATKAALQSAKIAPGTVVAFATHGLVTGEIEGLREPALLLSAADGDDGLLTASEISRMDIPASWVVLSACNTAAGSGSDAPNLSGLAQAFILAGADNILATYWPVRDDVARALSSGTLRHAAAGSSPAEALRQSMRDLRKGQLADAQSPRQWAAFELIAH